MSEYRSFFIATGIRSPIPSDTCLATSDDRERAGDMLLLALAPTSKYP
jgi:hypothetical protein